MSVDVVMPQLGESVVEGTITRWLKGKGEAIQELEPLLEINTDKVDTEIPSPASGTLLDVLVPEGTTVHAGTVLARIGLPEEAGQVAEPVAQGAAAAAQNGGTAAQAVPAEKQAVRAEEPAREPAAQGGRDLGFISPVVSKIAQEYHVNLTQVEGTGQAGRITKKDILAYIERREKGQKAVEAAAAPPAPAPAAPRAPAAAPAVAAAAVSLQAAAPAGDEIQPLTPVRRMIAEHMVLSKHTSPHVTTVMEADFNRVAAHREAHKAEFGRDGVNLTYTAYLVAAIVGALKAYPIVNSSWSDEGVVYHRAINVGMAVSLGEEGLIVPVIKNADSLSLLGLARTINDLTNRARIHKLLPDEVKGGTFTLTNHGTSGSLFATPIINQPQCGILGAGAIQKRVVVINDAIAIRPMAYLSLTFDHRILDGAIGDTYLAKVVELIQHWGEY